MKWFTNWWGIGLIAENTVDEKLLERLAATLPEEAENVYEDGFWEFDDTEEQLTLVFIR